MLTLIKENRRAILLSVLPALMIASLFVFGVKYPTLHGDGEGAIANQAGAFQGFAAALRTWIHEYAPRPMLTCWNWSVTHLSDGPAWAGAARVQGILCGTAAVVLVWMLSLRFAWASMASVLALQTVLLMSTGMLGAYGHFDGYADVLPLVLAWAAVVYFGLLSARVDRIIVAAGLLPLLIMGFWAHYALAVLPVYTLMALVFLRIDARGTGIPRWTIILFAVAAGLLPAFTALGRNPDLAIGSGFLAPMLRERVWLLFRTAAPALALAAMVLLWRSRKLWPIEPAEALGWTVLGAAAIQFFIVPADLGFADELLLGVFATFMTVGAVLVAAHLCVPKRLTVAAALVAAACYVPRMACYSGDGLVDYFKSRVETPCRYTRSVSPYYWLAMSMPVTTKAGQVERLAAFRRGFEAPKAQWADGANVVRCWLAYTVWCYEFGDTNAGREQIMWGYANAPAALPVFAKKGAAYSDRYLAAGYRIAVRDIEAITQ